MKRYNFLTLLLTFTIFIGCNAATENPSETAGPNTASGDSTSYNSQLAQELGADEYGMHRYVVAFLKAGPNRDQDSTTAAELQRAHMQNIQRMADEGKLVLAGPFMDDGPIRGLYIFDVDSIEEAEKLTETDPAIQQGRLTMELHPWYGSAAVKKINELHQQISKNNP